MAKDSGYAAFTNLVMQNKDAYERNKGATNPYADLKCPPGPYYGRLPEMLFDSGKYEAKNPDGSKSGFKKDCPRVRLKVVIACSADPQCPPSELEEFSGTSGYVQYLLSDDAAWANLYGALADIGVNTHNLKLLQQECTSEEHFTFAQLAEGLKEQQPTVKLAVTEKDGRKYMNLRGAVNQDELEQLLGHPLDTHESSVVETGYESVPEAPFEAAADEPVQVADEASAGEEAVWDEEHSLWHMLSDDTWYDSEGNPVPHPNPPKPVAPRIPPKIGAAKPAVAPAAPVAPKPAAPAVGGLRKPGTVPARK